MRIGNIEISDEALRVTCRKWKIRKLELFGSARTGQLRPDSDIDLLAEFEADEQWSLMDLVHAQEEFTLLFGRKVDLVDRGNLLRSTNWIRRDAILNSAEVVYGPLSSVCRFLDMVQAIERAWKLSTGLSEAEFLRDERATRSSSWEKPRAAWIAGSREPTPISRGQASSECATAWSMATKT